MKFLPTELAGLQKCRAAPRQLKHIYQRINGIIAACLFLCRPVRAEWVSDALTIQWCALILCVCVCFQHALRLLAFGQLYKVLNMDPLPACKPSPRLLEGECSAVSVFVFHVNMCDSLSACCVVCVCVCVFVSVYVHNFCWLFLSPNISCIFASL